jgi:hypothetical protein
MEFWRNLRIMIKKGEEGLIGADLVLTGHFLRYGGGVVQDHFPMLPLLFEQVGGMHF